jgi:hypothetical protein
MKRVKSRVGIKYCGRKGEDRGLFCGQVRL